MSKDNNNVVSQDYVSEIEKRLSFLDYLSEYYKNVNNVNGKLRASLLFAPFVCIPLVLPPMVCAFSSYDYNELVTFLGENIKYGYYITILESLFLVPIGGIMSLTDYFYNYKRSLKRESGVQEEKEGLKQLLQKRKECLELQREEDDTISNVDEIGKMYYAIGYHYKKYLKYYQKGILCEKLQKWYSEEQILEIENDYEEKGFARIRKIDKGCK